MYVLGITVAVILATIGSNIYFYFRSASGDMDVKWDNEKQCWEGVIHLDKDINYSQKRKLILKINHK